MNISEEQNIDLSQQNQLDSSRFTKNKVGGRWDHQQHLKFLHAIVCFGKDWKKVEEQVTTRTGAQVRSHAQKYFLKITKIIKDRKKIKGKKVPETTETELQLKQYFILHPLTEHTPKQIMELLKIQKVGIKDVLQENCSDNQNIHIKDLLESNDKYQKKNNEKQNKIIQNTKKNRSGLPEDLQQYEEQSFYMWFMKKNQQHFANGGLFSALIDLGKDLKGKFSLDQQQTSGNRKHSFTIFDNDLNPNQN